MGVPLVDRDGVVFGTLCGVSSRAQPRSFARHLPTAELVARLLSSLVPLGDLPGAVRPGAGHSGSMTTPEPDLPQPRDIAIEQQTPDQAAALEAASDPEEPASEAPSAR
jgi:hypothetical protein